MGRITRDRALTDDEKVKYAQLRRQIEDQLPEIRRRGLAAKPRVLLRHVLHALKQERERQGISLADVNQKTGIDCERLQQLEDDQEVDVSMNTLWSYAEAIGKTLVVQIEDQPVAS